MLGEGALDLLSTTVAVRIGARGAKMVPQEAGCAPPQPGSAAGSIPASDLATVAEADDLVAIDLDALARDRPDNRIKTGAVTAPSQHADAHVGLPFPCYRCLTGERLTRPD